MKRIILATALIACGALPVVAQDRAQLIAAAGLTAAEARSMSLTEIAATKFNRDSGHDQTQVVFRNTAPIMVDPVRHAQLIAAANLTPEQASDLTLADLVIGKYNAEASQGDAQVQIATRGPVRALPTQLIAAAGLTPIEARGMSLNELYVAKINRESRGDDRQGF